jgi:hypothetical protein
MSASEDLVSGHLLHFQCAVWGRNTIAEIIDEGVLESHEMSGIKSYDAGVKHRAEDTGGGSCHFGV